MNEDRVHFQEGGMVHTVSKSCLRGMGLSAGFMCILFLLYGINPQAAALAADSTVISEPLSGSYVNRLTASAFPIEIRDTIPQDDAGIVNFARVPDHTAVAVLVRAVNGIDLDAPSAVRFSIDDGYHLPYPRYLGHDAVRAVKLNQDPDGQATHVWLTYDRCLEPFMPTAYPLSAVVRVTVTIRDIRNHLLQPASFEFKIESSAQKAVSERNIPPTVEFYEGQLLPGNDNDAGLEVVAGKLAGAKLYYSSLEPIIPEFGDPADVPATDAEDMQAVGLPLNLLAHTVFDHPVQLFIPVAEDVDITNVGLAYFDGTRWLPAADADGRVLPGGQGWMVPGSRINHQEASPPLIEVQVYHFSAAQAVVFARFGDPLDEDKPPSHGSNANVHISCFINSVSTDASFHLFGLVELVGILGFLLRVFQRWSL
jgi:hypothetical protein